MKNLTVFICTDTEVRITDHIDDAGFAVLGSLYSVTWHCGCQYNNSNMPDVNQKAMTAIGGLFLCLLLA